MTLPVSGSISLTMVMDELRVTSPSRAYPISLGDADVRSLAGISSGPISLSDLLGKSSYIPMTLTTTGDTSGPVSSDNSGGTVVGTATSSLTGGIGPFTYSWAIIQNNNAVQVGATTNPTLSGSKSFVQQSSGSASVLARLTVTDSTARSVTSQDTYIELYWGTSV